MTASWMRSKGAADPAAVMLEGSSIGAVAESTRFVDMLARRVSGNPRDCGGTRANYFKLLMFVSPPKDDEGDSCDEGEIRGGERR
jgi:hypothetical protein